MLLSVIGTGYLGATHAAALVDLGHDVIGVDVDAAKVDALARGDLPFHEPGLPELLGHGLESGRLRFTTDATEAAGADAHFLCVGTPQTDGSGALDLTALDAAADPVADVMRPDALVIGKSTVPVGTAAALRDRLSARRGHPVTVVWNPEFLREGMAVEDSLRPERLVIGADDAAAADRARAVYAPLERAGIRVMVTDLATAELAKASANVMLAARLSVLNVLAEVCAVGGGRIEDLTAILGADSRIGPQYLRPGTGFGGSCLGKDLRGFAARAAELGLKDPTTLLDAVDEVNLRRREQIVAVVRQALGPRGGRVAVLGAAFKKDSDDIRDSPGVAVATALADAGLAVTVHDPAALDVLRRHHPDLPTADTALEACAGADVVALLTDWDQYRELDPVELGRVVGAPRLVDARLLLDESAWAAAGWTVLGAGWGAA